MWQGSYTFVVNQWGVGHGGFHSQSIEFQALDRNPTALAGESSQVNLIYDCGSGRGNLPRPALNVAIDTMLQDLDDDSIIDLLVVSHFDRDHVNGLDLLATELQRKGIRVARVWAPILTAIEALYIATNIDTSVPGSAAYASFVEDPVGRLSELFPEASITQVEPNDSPIPFPQTTPDTEPENNREVTLAPTANGRGLVAQPGAQTGTEPLWEIQPYMIESTLVGARKVAASVNGFLNKPLGRYSFTDISKLATNKKLLTKFHSAVKAHHRQLSTSGRTSSARTGPNLSTLCVYSGPVSPYDWCHFRSGWASVQDHPDAIPIAPAWLGTGDAGLHGPSHVDAIRKALTQGRLDRVGVTSAPHHGSHHDSSAHFWDALSNVRKVTIEASRTTGGTGNNHPHSAVLNELSKRNLTTHFCIDGDDFRWSDKRIR